MKMGWDGCSELDQEDVCGFGRRKRSHATEVRTLLGLLDVAQANTVVVLGAGPDADGVARARRRLLLLWLLPVRRRRRGC